LVVAGFLIPDIKIVHFLKYRRISLIMLTGISLIMVCIELPYRLTPEIPEIGNRRIYIIGDSISAGMDTGTRLWPEIMAEKYSFDVVNLAIPGETTGMAKKQALKIQEGSAFILLEIGGNDLLGRDPDPDDFESDLDKLLDMIRGPQRVMVMMELPLMPLSNRFGEVQRRLASKYNCILIPKRYMTKVFAADNATLDGLHLSETGHDLMAGIIGDLLKQD
jgi:acyl-CoA thioesterase-1